MLDLGINQCTANTSQKPENARVTWCIGISSYEQDKSTHAHTQKRLIKRYISIPMPFFLAYPTNFPTTQAIFLKNSSLKNNAVFQVHLLTQKKGILQKTDTQSPIKWAKRVPILTTILFLCSTNKTSRIQD